MLWPLKQTSFCHNRNKQKRLIVSKQFPESIWIGVENFMMLKKGEETSTGFRLILLLWITLTKYHKRPCKIWAPYVGHCIKKSLAPKSKYVDTPKPGSINCLGCTMELVICNSVLIVHGKKGFYIQKWGPHSNFFLND